LYAAYKRGDAEQKQRIVEAPLLFLNAAQAVTASGDEPDALVRVVRDLEAVAAAAVRARTSVHKAVQADRSTPPSAQVRRAYQTAKRGFEALVRTIEDHDERPGHAHGHCATAP
jgi:hypothetical protein